jgi:hypothetical protein
MHDNARPHIAGIVRDYPEETNITTMVWPARSPDLKPIEHVWDMLGRRLRASDPRANSLAEVRNRLVEIGKIWTKTILELKSKACNEDVRPSSEPEVEIHVTEPQTKGWLRLTDTQVLFYYNLLFFFYFKNYFS